MKIVPLTLILTILKECRGSSISRPLAQDKDISEVLPRFMESKSKSREFFNSSIMTLDYAPYDVTHGDYSSCDIDIKVKWIASVGSSVYSSPIIHPVDNHHDRMSIFVATFYDFIEMINSDGSKPIGWPLSIEGSSFQGSPLLYDIDGDGNNDLCVVDKNANIYWIRIGEVGQYLEDYHTQVPRLKVKKDWYKGLDTTYVDRYAGFSMFDHEHNPHYESTKSKKVPSNKVKIDDLFTGVHEDLRPEISSPNAADKGADKKKLHYVADKSSVDGPQSDQDRRRLQELVEDSSRHDNENESREKTGLRDLDSLVINQDQEQVDHRDISEVENSREQQSLDPSIIDEGSGEDGQDVESAAAHALEAAEAEAYSAGIAALEEAHEGGEPDTFLGGRFGDGGEGDLPNADSYKFDDYRASIRDGGGYRSFDDGAHYYMNMGPEDEADVVYIDPHVLNSPSLIDVDGDGVLEILVAVSYYFDMTQYPAKSDTENSTDIDRSMYVAGGLACWDIENDNWKWLVHLDLTTDKTRYRAYIHGAPTVADLDGDGRFEVLIGTSLGLLYLLDGDTGFTRRNFPIQFHSIEAQIVVADVTNINIDGKHDGGTLEIIVADMAGNLVAVSSTGDILWDIQLAGALPYTPTIGDVDGDGQLDIVVVAVRDIEDPTSENVPKNGTSSSEKNKLKKKIHSSSLIYAVNAASGKILNGYPISLPRGVRATGSIVLADLHPPLASGGLSTPFKYSDPNVPDWILDEESDRGHGHRQHKRPAASPALAPALSVDEMYSHYNLSKENSKQSPSAITHSSLYNRGLHMLVPSFEGHVYIIAKSFPPSSNFTHANDSRTHAMMKRSPTACAQRIDVGEHIVSVPLIADVDRNGQLDIIIGTLNGQVYNLETSLSAHPLNTWTSFPNRRSSTAVTVGSVGISVPEHVRKSLKFSDKRVSSEGVISVVFDIWDTRPRAPLKSPTVVTDEVSELVPRKYVVIISRGTNKKAVLNRGEFTSPGRYSLTISVTMPMSANLVLSMETEYGLYYEDTVWVSLGTRFYVWMKYLPMIPAALLCLPLILMRNKP